MNIMGVQILSLVLRLFEHSRILFFAAVMMISSVCYFSSLSANDDDSVSVNANENDDATASEQPSDDKDAIKSIVSASPERRYADGMFVPDALMPGGLIEIDRAVIAKTRYGKTDKSFDKSTPLLNVELIKALKDYPVIGVVAYGGTQDDAPVVALRVTYMFDRYKALPFPDSVQTMLEKETVSTSVINSEKSSEVMGETVTSESSDSQGEFTSVDDQCGVSTVTECEVASGSHEGCGKNACDAGCDNETIRPIWHGGNDGIMSIQFCSVLPQQLLKDKRLKAFQSGVDIENPTLTYLAGFGVIVEIRADRSLDQSILEKATALIRARLAAELEKERAYLETQNQLFNTYCERTQLKQFANPNVKPVWTALDMVFNAFYEKKF